MVTNDATLVKLKHKIMEETARLAWDGNLDEEHKEKLIYEIIPGGNLSSRGSAFRRRRIPTESRHPRTSCRSFARPAKSAPFPHIR